MDEESYELTEITSFSDLGLGAMDFCSARAITVAGTNDFLACVYASFILVVDAKYNGILTCLEGYVDFSDYLVPDPDGGMNFLVGIAYAGKNTLGTHDWVYLLDMNGNLYKTSIKLSGANFGGLNNAVSLADDVTLVCNLGYKVDMPYLQSLYYDGTDLYWTRYDSGENDVDLILVRNVDKKSQREIVEVGSFEGGVWPVGGLYKQGEHLNGLKVTELEDGDGTVIPAPASTNAAEEVDFQAVRELLMREYGGKASRDEGAENLPVPPEDATPEATSNEPLGEESAPVPYPGDGTLDSVVARPQAVSVSDGAAENIDGTVSVTAFVKNTTNGLITVKYNSSELVLVSYSSPVQGLTSAKKSSGKLTFGFAVSDASKALPLDGEMLKLSFRLKDGVNVSTVQVQVRDRNKSHNTTWMPVTIGEVLTLSENDGSDGGNVIIRSSNSNARYRPVVPEDSLDQVNGAFQVTYSSACIVIVRMNGEYFKLFGTQLAGDDANTYRFLMPEGFAQAEDFQAVVAVRGDVNGDGRVRANDASTAASYAVKNPDPTQLDIFIADVVGNRGNGDGRVRANDASAISSASVGVTAFSWLYLE